MVLGLTWGQCTVLQSQACFSTFNHPLEVWFSPPDFNPARFWKCWLTLLKSIAWYIYVAKTPKDYFCFKGFFNPVSSTTTRTGWERTCPAATSSFCDGPQLFLPLFIHMCLAYVWLLLVLRTICWGRAWPLAPNLGSCRRGAVVSLYNSHLNFSIHCFLLV